MQNGQLVFRPPVANSKPAMNRAELASRLFLNLPFYNAGIRDTQLSLAVGMGDAELCLVSLGFRDCDLQSLKGKRFLDLGCGAASCPDSNTPGLSMHAPWLSRYLYEAGAAVVGIEMLAQVGERFMSYQIDLSKRGALSFIPEKSFDIMFCNGLIDFSDPSSGETSPSIKAKEGGEARNLRELKEIMEELKSQAHRILEIGGKLMNGFNRGVPNLFENISSGLVRIR